MLGRDTVYDRVPYFYTDQYDLGMKYTGHAGPGGYEQVVFRCGGGLGAGLPFPRESFTSMSSSSRVRTSRPLCASSPQGRPS